MKFRAILVLFLSVATVCSGVSANAKSKRSKVRGFSYFVDGNKASQGECDGEGKIPRHLKKQKELSKSRDYIGSESMESAGAEPSWKHYFNSKNSCNESLKRTGVAKVERN